MIDMLFCGKRTDNGEWMYGYYSNHSTGKTFIREVGKSCTGSYEVAPHTIGLYANKTDKNGKKIFTDCIVTDGPDSVSGIVRFGEYSNPFADGYHIGFYIEWGGKYHDILRKDLGYWARKENFEVIGNIHDNPELLEDKPDKLAKEKNNGCSNV